MWSDDWFVNWFTTTITIVCLHLYENYFTLCLFAVDSGNFNSPGKQFLTDLVKRRLTEELATSVHAVQQHYASDRTPVIRFIFLSTLFLFDPRISLFCIFLPTAMDRVSILPLLWRQFSCTAYGQTLWPWRCSTSKVVISFAGPFSVLSFFIGENCLTLKNYVYYTISVFCCIWNFKKLRNGRHSKWRTFGSKAVNQSISWSSNGLSKFSW